MGGGLFSARASKGFQSFLNISSQPAEIARTDWTAEMATPH